MLDKYPHRNIASKPNAIVRAPAIVPVQIIVLSALAVLGSAVTTAHGLCMACVEVAFHLPVRAQASGGLWWAVAGGDPGGFLTGPGPADSVGGPHSPDPESFAKATAVYGLHPFVAFAMIAVDHMLFAGELATGGLLAILSVFVGFLLVLPCALLQRFAYRDNWPAALGKALLVGLLTAIPTALPSVLIGGWGVVGLLGSRYRAAHPELFDTTDHEAR